MVLQVRLPRLQQAVHAQRPPRQARQDPQRQRKQEGQLRLVQRLRGEQPARRQQSPRLREPHASARRRRQAGPGLSPVGSGALLPVPPVAPGPHP